MSETSQPEVSQVPSDPYAKITAAMEPGLLITVNCSTPLAEGIDEMEVIRSEDSGDLHLRANTGENFVITYENPDYPGPVIKEVSESEFTPIEEQVTTIEVVGLDS